MESSIMVFVEKSDLMALIERSYKRGFDEYTLAPSKLHPHKMIVETPFNKDSYHTEADQLNAMFGTIPNE